MKERHIIRNILCGTVLLCLSACAIKDDIPYPIIESAITAFEVEGQCDAEGAGTAVAQIDNTTRTVRAYVDDTVDLTNLKITRMEVSNEATICPDTVRCINPLRFPSGSFATAPYDANTRVNFTHQAVFTLKTYQDYLWTVTVQQIIRREIEVENQVGEAVIDPVNHNAAIYVASNQPFNTIRVKKFSLGGTHGTVIPNPVESETFDFSRALPFSVIR